MTPASAGARSFVALPLGAALGARVAERMSERMAQVLDAKAFRLARGEGLHLTLFFLGQVERERLVAIEAALREALAGAAAPVLRLTGAGAFPDPRRARVLWIGVEERAHLGRLEACRRAVLGGLAHAGIDTREEELRPFRPHVTVARPRGGGRVPREFGALAFGLDWDPPGVELLESHPGPGGSRYECLERFPFAGGE